MTKKEALRLESTFMESLGRFAPSQWRRVFVIASRCDSSGVAIHFQKVDSRAKVDSSVKADSRH
ncbi:hypothetical protein [Helicobacter canis]|nr:hypothetical protein [Helicobacter canis]